MKINSNSYSKINLVILSVALLAILTDFVLSFFQGSFTDSWWLGLGGLLIIILLIYRGPNEFKYDSEGEVLNFTTADALWGRLIRNYNKHYEFPKRRLHGYKMTNILFRRRLIIFIKSRSGGIKERSMLVSYLSGSQVKSLENSLKKYSQRGKNDGRKSGSKSRKSGEQS
ncbi:hypothetical protein [Croceimicrobium sp.]|uniref:hypothetical protein n=1 Tax=Croceimicrobium sp. TaxID=2828340 RepID=UPI003BA98860